MSSKGIVAMTTTQTLERPIQSTCTTCPYFQDFGERNGRGWCHLFDQTARQHHARTGDCNKEGEAVESAQQAPVLERKAQSSEAGLAGDSVRGATRKSEFWQYEGTQSQ